MTHADPSDQVLQLSPTHPSGFDGVICSPLGSRRLQAMWPDFVLMVPRASGPSAAPANDQKRAMTPRQAVDLGATNLVVQPPIYLAADPRAAAEAIAREAGVNDLKPEAKICGLSTAETVDAAVRFGARWVSFVTPPRSPASRRLQ